MRPRRKLARLPVQAAARLPEGARRSAGAGRRFAKSKPEAAVPRFGRTQR